MDGTASWTELLAAAICWPLPQPVGLKDKKSNRYQQFLNYRKISNISCTKFQNSNVSRLVLQLPLPNPIETSC